MPAVGLLFDLLPDDLLVGEVAAGLAVILLHASNLIYQSIRRSIWRGFVNCVNTFRNKEAARARRNPYSGTYSRY